MAHFNSQDSDGKKRSQRASEFLKTGSELTGKSGEVDGVSEWPASEASASTASEPELAPQEAPTKPRSGVVSSTIHYPIKQKKEQESPPPADLPSQTAPLASASVPKPLPLTEREKSRKREEQVERMADKIVGLAEGFVVFKTGMLNPQLTPSQKVKMVAQRYPQLFQRFGKLFAWLIPLIYPLILLLQKLNQKMMAQHMLPPVPQPESSDVTAPPQSETLPEPEKISFLDLAEINIIFCDNHKRPLYSLDKLRDKYGRTASEEVVGPQVFAEIFKAFQEVAVKAKGLPTPESGLFAGIPMDAVMENASERDILLFLNYVKRFPRGYTGKNFRITESFAGWVISGTPDD